MYTRSVLALISLVLPLVACSGSQPPPDLAAGVDVFECSVGVLKPYVASLPEAEALVRKLLSGEVSVRDIVGEVHSVERALLDCQSGVAADAGADAAE